MCLVFDPSSFLPQPEVEVEKTKDKEEILSPPDIGMEDTVPEALDWELRKKRIYRSLRIMNNQGVPGSQFATETDIEEVP